MLIAMSHLYPQETVSFYAFGFTDPTVRSEDWGSVRELAFQYVGLIREEQRHGPYFLAGYSYGGLLAFEMACILTEEDEIVEFVTMIDTFPWHPQSESVATRLASSYADNSPSEYQVQVCVPLIVCISLDTKR